MNNEKELKKIFDEHGIVAIDTKRYKHSVSPYLPEERIVSHKFIARKLNNRMKKNIEDSINDLMVWSDNLRLSNDLWRYSKEEINNDFQEKLMELKDTLLGLE